MISLVLLSLSDTAYGQRADENVVLAAEDAFGTSIGDEDIGLYSANEARGFSPSQAGNIRLNDLYFERRAPLAPGLSRGATVRVGLTAQSNPFPAPTGVIDQQLRIPGDQQISSVIISGGSWAEYGFHAETQTPVIEGNLVVALSAGASHLEFAHKGTASDWTASTLAVLKPSDSIEIIPFWGRYQRYGGEAIPSFTSTTIPPRIPRREFYAQDWTEWDFSQSNFGSIVNVKLNSDWTIRAGLFRSLMNLTQSYLDMYLDVQPDGSATHVIIANPPQRYGSVSGEIRASGVFTEGSKRQHVVHFALRGHDVKRRFDGADRLVFGSELIGVRMPIAKPEFNFSERNLDNTNRIMGGVAYEGMWQGVGELSLGLQKAFNTREIRISGAAPTRTDNNPWLYNGTLAAYLGKNLVAYTSYTRGLEDSGVAPDQASNRGEAAPASLSRQVDAGLRYSLDSGLTLVGGVFEVKKPFFDIDTTNLFRAVGTLTHRGVELSVAGPVTEGLHVVLGTVFLQARLSNPLGQQFNIGKVPLGRVPRLTRLNIQYGPPNWNGFAIDGQIENKSSQYADRANSSRLPGSTTINIGGRYQFEAFDSPVTLRVQVKNVTNKFAWDIPSPGRFQPFESRHVLINLTTDF